MYAMYLCPELVFYGIWAFYFSEIRGNIVQPPTLLCRPVQLSSLRPFYNPDYVGRIVPISQLKIMKFSILAAIFATLYPENLVIHMFLQ